RARIAHGIAASFVAAMVQSAVAVAAIAILAGALALAPAAVMDKAAWLEVGSFAMIAAVGMVMTWRSLTGRSGCGHAHHHPGAGCCADHHHHHDDPRGLMAAAAAVGFRPCSGALLVLLFTWANGIAWVGVAATFAMGIGVGLTVSGIGLGALGLNRAVERLTGGSRWAGRLSSALALAGALAVTVLGLAMLAGSLIDGPALTG
ncbi:MAG: ABC transporter, partial [Magnetospirillum sp.]|nr:ABC transporter [Magnetospirillum sp.]